MAARCEFDGLIWPRVGGRFETGVYRLDIDVTVLYRADASTAPVSTVEERSPRPTRASRRRPAATGDQLSLLTP